jgi:DNA-binding LacI/PurR family transcriptional regulator
MSNIQVPQDLAIIGFDCLKPIVPYHYQLTTISAPWSQIAYTAVSTLVDVVKGSPTVPETILPVELHEGTTT